MKHILTLTMTIFIYSCGTATAYPLDWSQSQRNDLELKYKTRDVFGVSEFYKKHGKRQYCVNLKKYGKAWDKCLSSIAGRNYAH